MPELAGQAAVTRKTATWGRPSAAKQSGDILVVLTQQRLRQLLQLTHPDRHDDSTLSKEIFQWLQEIRSKELDKQK
jgi:hypothetical protein